MKNTKTNRFLLVLVLMGVLLSSNCATLISRPSQIVPVTSQPPGARIIADGKDMGYAPLGLKLKKKAVHLIRIEKEGFNPVEIKIERNKSGIGALAIAGDFLLGLAAGLAVHYVVWQASGRPDEEMRMTVDFWLGCLAGWIGFGILDGRSSARYALTPRELTVALTKADGTPRLETILLDADELQNIKWIRIHRD